MNPDPAPAILDILGRAGHPRLFTGSQAVVLALDARAAAGRAAAPDSPRR